MHRVEDGASDSAAISGIENAGGSWHFEGEEDHFPCRVKNGPLAGGHAVIDTSVSSQFATVMLSASLCPQGIRAEFKGKRSSTPYLELTRKLMEELGLSLDLSEDGFSVPHQPSLSRTTLFRGTGLEQRGICCSAPGDLCCGAIRLEGLQADSPQGDRRVLEYFGQLGLVVRVEGQAHLLWSAAGRTQLGSFRLDFSDCPDLSMSWATAVAALGMESRVVRAAYTSWKRIGSSRCTGQKALVNSRKWRCCQEKEC